MANPYTSQSISGYNDNPPSDDGANVSSNEISWSKHKDKLGDPVKTLSESVNTEVLSAFGKIFGNAVSSKSSNYTILEGDQGTAINFTTGGLTATLPDATAVGQNFVVTVINSNANTSIIIVGPSSQTVNSFVGGLTIGPGGHAILFSDATNWWASVSHGARATVATRDTTYTHSGSDTPIEFDGEVFDTDGSHDNVTNNSRLTVKTGTRVVKLTTNIRFGTQITNANRVELWKNGSLFGGASGRYFFNQFSAGGDEFFRFVSEPLKVSTDDYFELVATGANQFTITDGTFAMEVLG